MVVERIAAAVVPEDLAACVNILPGLRSIFFREGRVEDEREVLLLMKTRADRLAPLEARVRASIRTRCPGSSRCRSSVDTSRT